MGTILIGVDSSAQSEDAVALARLGGDVGKRPVRLVPVGHDEGRPAPDLVVDLADVFAHDAERHELDPGEEEDDHHQRRPPGRQVVGDDARDRDVEPGDDRDARALLEVLACDRAGGNTHDGLAR